MIRIILPAVLAFLLGFLYGGRLRFTGSLKAALAAGLLFALLLHTYPYYDVYYSALPTSFSETFFFALAGVLYGSTRRKDESNPSAH